MNYTCTRYPNNRANLYIITRKTSFKRSSVVNYHSHNKIRRFWNNKTLILYRYINKHEAPPPPGSLPRGLSLGWGRRGRSPPVVPCNTPSSRDCPAYCCGGARRPCTPHSSGSPCDTVYSSARYTAPLGSRLKNTVQMEAIATSRALPANLGNTTRGWVFFIACRKGPKRCFWIDWGRDVFSDKNVQCKSNQICFSTNVYIQHHSIVIYLTILPHCCSTYWFFINVREHKCLWI